ncbi:MAG: hypothetical protein PHR81_11500, partial [Bacteroidales bacterium]|nr:hypothetical protein [Bacteroidales bacterium]
IYYNSINLTGAANRSTATVSAAIYIASAVTSLDIRNNIFLNAITNSLSTSDKAYAIYSEATNTAFTNINYNDYFAPTGGDYAGVLGYLTSDITTLAAWQTATAQDLNSVSANPDFFTDTDLHCFSLAVNELATPIAAVTDDFDGEPRNGTTPDIGADEFTVIDYNIAVLAVLQPVSDCGLSANENVVIRVKNVGLQPFSTAELYYKVNNGTPVHETMNQLINPGQTYDYTFTQQANLSLVGDYTFKVYASLTGDTVYFNDTINNYTINTGHVFANGPYTMGFEPTDDMLQWTKLDVNGDNYTWIFPYNGYAHTGSNCAELYNSSSVVADEWLFSRCFTMTAGATYKIEFWYQAESSYYPQNIDLKVGNSATPAAMTTNLLALASFTNTTYQKASVTFVPPTTGAYYFGWWGHSPDDYYFAYIDDINISLVPDQEAAIVEVIAPVSGCELTATENVIIKIKNEGALAINGNLTATYILNNGTPVTEPVAANILPGETYDFTFTQQVDLSVIGDYTFDFYVSYLGDTVQENDSLNNYTINTGHDFYSGAYTMGFEPTDDMSQWSMPDVNDDGSSWTFPYSYSTYAHSGDNLAFYEYNSYNPGDDWLFSRCFKLNAGSTYKIEYWYGSFDADYAESLDLKVGNAATPEAMTTPLVSMPAITNTTYQKASVTYTPSTTDNYYFGWYAYSAADAYYIAVDDINISLVPDQEAALISIDAPESGCGLSGTEPVTIKIANTGVDTITGNLNAYYQFNGGTVVMEPVSDTILAGDTLTFSFSQTVDAYVTDTNIEFPIQAWIVLTGDPFQYNDSLAKDIISLYVPAPPVTINDTTVYATPATLQAIAADSVYWYNVPTGGTSIATGSVFVTPPLFVETIYYAEASTGSGLNMTEPFDGATFPAGWSTVEGGSDYIEIVTTSSAGGTPNEAKITGSSFSNVTDILYYGPINTTGNNSLTLQWNNYMSHYSSYYPYSISVQTSTDLVTWHNTSWVVNPVTSDIDPGIQTLTINTQDVGSPTFYLAFTMSGETFGAYGWYIDDVILSGASGCPSARVPDTAFIELYPWEASIVSLPSPVTKCTEGIEDVTIRIRNNGFEIIDSLGAICTVNGVPLVSEIITDTILPGDTLTYTFSAPLIAGLTSANQDSVYNIIAYVGLIGDLFSFNDTITNLVTLLYTPPSPVVSNITVPYGTAGTFAPVSSDTLNWYDVPTGGTQIAQGATFTTPILYGTTVYYVEAISGIADIKLTEITHYRTGTGATSPYPSWCTGEDLIEISNLGTAPVNLENYTMNIYGVGNRSYIIPQVTLNGGEVMILCVGSGVDDPANRYYNIGGSDDVIQSGSLSGF